MKSINNILVVVDPTVERDFVVDRVKLIAKKTGAKTLLYINNVNILTEHSYMYDGVDGEFFETRRKLFAEHYRNLLAQLEKEFRADNLQVSSLFSEQHHLAEAIIEQARKHKPDLVVKSTHHHGMLERALVTNTDWRLIRKCPAPLLLIKPQPWNEDGSVVTAVDPLHSKAAQSSLDHALITSTELVSGLLKQTPRVFHSYYPFISGMFPMSGESADYMQTIRQKHKDKLEELLSEHKITEENVHLSQGELVPKLIEYLKSVNANILVIGALSRNFLERAIVGNTAEKILEGCPCDILVIKPA